jgi:FkbM family methyltransferase
MIFYNENNQVIDNASIERQEQDLVNQYINENDCVLELGARYGTVSCAINKILTVKTNQVVVEPDKRVWGALERNRINNDCKFNIVNGFLSNKKLGLTNLNVCLNGYGATFIVDNSSAIPSYSMQTVKQTYNIAKFNVLVADCEGFLEIFFDENPDIYQDLRLVVFEADYPDKCNYDKIKRNLKQNGFTKILDGHQNVWQRLGR